MSRRRSRLAIRLLLALAVCVQLAVLYAPDPPAGMDAVAMLPGADKLVHALVFGAVAVTGRLAGVPVRWLAAGLVAHAGVSELVQHALLPQRAGDPSDVLADLAGTALGLVLPRSWRRTPSSAAADRGTMAP